MIRAVVLTYNEAGFIAGCIQSIQHVSDDVFVLDAHSTDGTPELAAGLDATVEAQNWLGFAGARNLALGRCRDVPWTLFVDADERISPGLAREIRDAAETASPDVDGFLIPRRNVICGRVMRGGGWWPDYQLRLLRPGRCRYAEDTRVHEVPTCRGTVLALNTPLVHLNYRTWREFLRKQLAFARLASAASPRPRQRAYLGAPVRTIWRRFVSEQGFRDGPHGLFASVILGVAELYRVWLARRRKS